MAELIEGVNPTRMELLKLKEKVKLAEKGHRLLKEKRDALIMEFFNILEDAKRVRKEAEATLTEAFQKLVIAETTAGPSRVSEAALAATSKSAINLDFGSQSIMGIKVPVLRMSATSRKVAERGYSVMDTPSMLDEAASKFEEVLLAIMRLAEVEESVKRLAEEIESTKRRVNALEYIVIPRLMATVKYIKMRLDEMERENFFKLKRIKAVMEA